MVNSENLEILRRSLMTHRFHRAIGFRRKRPTSIGAWEGIVCSLERPPRWKNKVLEEVGTSA
jgi:hypothetical protein